MPEPSCKVTVMRGLAASNRDAAIALYWQAFGGKLGLVMGPRAKALRFVGLVMSNDHVFSAVDGQGRLLGVIGFRTQHSGFVGGTAQDLRGVYGPFGAAWRQRVMGLVADDLPAGVLAIDGLVVTPSHRGQGVGQALIHALVQQARAQGYGRLRLEVTGRNRRARILYHRLGFRVVSRHFNPLVGIMFGFARSYTMEKVL